MLEESIPTRLSVLELEHAERLSACTSSASSQSNKYVICQKHRTVSGNPAVSRKFLPRTLLLALICLTASFSTSQIARVSATQTDLSSSVPSHVAGGGGGSDSAHHSPTPPIPITHDNVIRSEGDNTASGSVPPRTTTSTELGGDGESNSDPVSVGDGQTGPLVESLEGSGNRADEGVVDLTELDGAQGGSASGQGHTSGHVIKRYPIIQFDFAHVSSPYIISLWIIIVGLAKIGFHMTPKVPTYCPESVMLMVLGVLIGVVMYYSGVMKKDFRPLTPDLFFLFMLPPIVMDAGYHMPNRMFFDNLPSILLYAVVGTVWNSLSIGLSLYGCYRLGLFGSALELSVLDTFLFSSIISAVDPVAVLAVFEEVHVNEVLYILVFGESLLNDAVTVVLYHMFEGYSEIGLENTLPIDYISGIASFFVVSLGGTIMGIIWGILAAFVSRFTHHVKIIEPIFPFVMAYLAYLSAELFHLSGILSLTFCGITMKNYVEENISQTSQTTLKYAMKMLANSSESIIFLFLGVCTVNDIGDWNTAFIVATVVFCLAFRAIGVGLLTAVTNRFRVHRLAVIEQFILAYGGLRGAVAFALVLVVDENLVPAKKTMITTVIAVVYFTVVLQGTTVGPLVKLLNVPRARQSDLTMNERIHIRVMDHIMAGVEDITGLMIGNYKFRDKFRYYNTKYLRNWLLRDQGRQHMPRKIFETASKLDLQDAIKIVNKQNSAYSSINSYYYNQQSSTDRFNGGGPGGVPGGGGGHGGAARSLSALFRNFTTSNQSLNNGGVNQHPPLAKLDPTVKNQRSPTYSTTIPIDSDSASFNFDLGNLEYSPSHRDLKDAEIHHILDINLQMPTRRYKNYSKTDIEEPSKGPQEAIFQHQVRMMKVLSKKRLKRGNGSRNQNGGVRTSPNGSKKERFLKPPLLQRGNNNILTYSPPESPDQGDLGITFTAHENNNNNNGLLKNNTSQAAGSPPKVIGSNSIKKGRIPPALSALAKTQADWSLPPSLVSHLKPLPPPPISPLVLKPPTITEASLPWRRSPHSEEHSACDHGIDSKECSTEGSPENHPPGLLRGLSGCRQEEFPPWITNPEYITAYASPTETYLGAVLEQNISNQQPVPSIHEIFTIHESPSGASNTSSMATSAANQAQQHDTHSIQSSSTHKPTDRRSSASSCSSMAPHHADPNVPRKHSYIHHHHKTPRRKSADSVHRPSITASTSTTKDTMKDSTRSGEETGSSHANPSFVGDNGDQISRL